MLVPDEIRKSVCFIAYDSQNGERKLAGTGFLIALPSQTIQDLNFPYLTTAKHVIKGIQEKSKDGMVYIRLNVGDGYGWGTSSIEDWAFHDDDPFVDVAVLETGGLPPEHGHLGVPLRSVLTDEIILKEGIGIGEETIIVGLFAKHYGRKRNVPIVRIGNIAAMPEEPTRTMMWGNIVDIDAYLIEARSIGGLSGSPVFVNLGQFRYSNGRLKTAQSAVLYLLGLVHGHWDLKVSHEDIAGLSKEEKEAFNMGIAMIVPVAKIFEVLNSRSLSESRRKREEEIIDRDLPTLDIGDVDTDLGTDQEKQAFSREDFESALRRVSRRQSSLDEGKS